MSQLTYLIFPADPEMDLVPAIDMALQHMRTGERCRLLVKSKYGFGSEGSKKFEIPPDADLEYELLLKIFEKIKEPWQMTDHERVENSKKLKERGNGFVKVTEFTFLLYTFSFADVKFCYPFLT